MNRKDYELIGAAFADTKPRDESPDSAISAERRYLATVLAARLRAADTAFDVRRFLVACGVQQ